MLMLKITSTALLIALLGAVLGAATVGRYRIQIVAAGLVAGGMVVGAVGALVVLWTA